MAPTTPPPTLKDMLQTLLHPWIFMSMSMYYLPGTIYKLILKRDLQTLLWWPRFQCAPPCSQLTPQFLPNHRITC
jgi:hypothetical protein